MNSRNIYAFDTIDDRIEADVGVDHPYVSGIQKWNGNRPLLIERPMVRIPRDIVTGSIAAEVLAIVAMFSCIGTISR